MCTVFFLVLFLSLYLLSFHLRWHNKIKTNIQLYSCFEKQNFECKIVNIFLSISFNICFKYPQRMFWLRNWLRNKKNIFWVRTLILTKGLCNVKKKILYSEVLALLFELDFGYIGFREQRLWAISNQMFLGTMTANVPFLIAQHALKVPPLIIQRALKVPFLIKLPCPFLFLGKHYNHTPNQSLLMIWLMATLNDLFSFNNGVTDLQTLICVLAIIIHSIFKVQNYIFLKKLFVL